MTRAHISSVTHCRGQTRNVAHITRPWSPQHVAPCLLRSGFLKIRDAPTQPQQRRQFRQNRLIAWSLRLVKHCRTASLEFAQTLQNCCWFVIRSTCLMLLFCRDADHLRISCGISVLPQNFHRVCPLTSDAKFCCTKIKVPLSSVY